MTPSRVEVITAVERRRRWPQAEKERLVALSLEPGTSASQIARSAGLHVMRPVRGFAEPPLLVSHRSSQAQDAVHRTLRAQV